MCSLSNLIKLEYLVLVSISENEKGFVDTYENILFGVMITSFPVSSQSIAKSKSTSLVRWTKIEGATTLRCTPRKNRKMMNTVERLKNGWFISDAKNGTSAV